MASDLYERMGTKENETTASEMSSGSNHPLRPTALSAGECLLRQKCIRTFSHVTASGYVAFSLALHEKKIRGAALAMCGWVGSPSRHVMRV
jgi:hypothetical protein